MYVLIRLKLMGALHKLRPDGQRALSAFELEVAVVVEAHPHHADDLGCESRKPAIARCAGFSGRRKNETHGAGACPGARSAQNILHHVLDQVRHPRIDSRLSFRLGLKYDSAVDISNRAYEATLQK